MSTPSEDRELSDDPEETRSYSLPEDCSAEVDQVRELTVATLLKCVANLVGHKVSRPVWRKINEALVRLAVRITDGKLMSPSSSGGEGVGLAGDMDGRPIAAAARLELPEPTPEKKAVPGPIPAGSVEAAMANLRLARERLAPYRRADWVRAACSIRIIEYAIRVAHECGDENRALHILDASGISEKD